MLHLAEERRQRGACARAAAPAPRAATQPDHIASMQEREVLQYLLNITHDMRTWIELRASENFRQRPLIPNLARPLIRRKPWGGLKGLLECQSQPLDAYYHLG